MKIIEAQESDSERLSAFLGRTARPGRIGLHFRRPAGFFEIYRIQSDHFKTYLLQGDNDEIHGCATLVFRQGHLDGGVETIGFARDLRLSKNREAVTQWPRHFEKILRKELKENGCRFFFANLGDVEREAYRAFIRPKAIRREIPRYFLFRRFQLIALHGRWPTFDRSLSTIKVQPAGTSCAEELCEYLQKQGPSRPLAPVFQKSLFAKAADLWPGLDLENFLLARDAQGKIIGCCAPWSSSSVQTLEVARAPLLAQGAHQLMTLGSVFGLTRPLSGKGKILKVSYLTHFFADNPDIFLSLLHAAWETSGQSQTLVYPQVEGHYQTLPPPSFLHSKTPCGVYTVLPGGAELPDFLRPSPLAPPPFIELALF